MDNDPFSDPQTARDFLAETGRLDDSEIDIFETALALAAVHRPSVSVDKYRNHFNSLIDNLKEKFEENSEKENGDTLAVQVDSLCDLLAQTHGYIGDDRDYDNLQNVDMMRVIDRRMGMPITLCILGIAVCRVVGWHADGLNFPGHFLMRLDKDGERMIIDPFQACKTLQASDLRLILKKNMGDKAELSGEYYEPCSNRDMILRLQNNIKFRLIESEHYQEALEIVDLMCLIAPDDCRLNLDMAVLLSRLERPRAAIENLEIYIAAVNDPKEKAEAEAFLYEIKSMLN